MSLLRILKRSKVLLDLSNSRKSEKKIPAFRAVSWCWYMSTYVGRPILGISFVDGISDPYCVHGLRNFKGLFARVLFWFCATTKASTNS